jgi:hypothetical protein
MTVLLLLTVSLELGAGIIVVRVGSVEVGLIEEIEDDAGVGVDEAVVNTPPHMSGLVSFGLTQYVTPSEQRAQREPESCVESVGFE